MGARTIELPSPEPEGSPKAFFTIRCVEYACPEQLYYTTTDAGKALAEETEKDRAYRDDFAKHIAELGGKLDVERLEFGCMKDLHAMVDRRPF